MQRDHLLHKPLAPEFQKKPALKKEVYMDALICIIIIIIIFT